MMPERLASKTIYESDWISLYEDKVKMPDGSIIDSYHRLHFPHESVCVVICNDKDEILMIQSKRYITGQLEWEIPAGRIKCVVCHAYTSCHSSMTAKALTGEPLPFFNRSGIP